ncbi:matrixin family metalloprotease [Sinomicrobium oceani]|uniref:matrixin family metalloprotease n=1 Tax=Sinomicrobium oceani TaxID=1150368 RepID=UPI00227C804A|nr:matrixin family metalloprotease [Sinomicrobium oceani]
MKMQNLFVWMLMVPLIFASCSKEEINEAEDLNGQQETREFTEEELASMRVCKDVYPEGVTPRAAAVSSKVWQNGQTLKVKFIGGSQYVRNKVMQYANEWSDYANITFQFVTSGTADIRVSFMSGQGSYSYIGTDANLISQNSETMNFGWFDSNTSDSEFSRTTIHEFGHALGLIHEHQHPEVTIPWDKPAVYAYYAGPPNYWSQSQVDNNLFATYSTWETQFSDYDPQSIMHYAVDNSLTIGNFSVGWNTILSNTDKQFIGELYPF